LLPPFLGASLFKLSPLCVFALFLCILAAVAIGISANGTCSGSSSGKIGLKFESFVESSVFVVLKNLVLNYIVQDVSLKCE